MSSVLYNLLLLLLPSVFLVHDVKGCFLLYTYIIIIIIMCVPLPLSIPRTIELADVGVVDVRSALAGG